MAQTKKKRQTKHRGNAAGIVEARGRTGRPPSPEEKKRQARDEARAERLNRPPSWSRAVRNSAIMAVIILVVLLLTNKRSGSAPAVVVVALLAFVVYVPGGYYMERFMWKRRMNKTVAPAARRGR
ncbi:MAG TPA: hypothetical protein VFN48_05325 [Solirubrobacteraceae bacterium]|nr:hypothetical protein [Solirubrobacteraceae bacterium]